MHGQYPKRVNEKDVDHQMTSQWLTDSWAQVRHRGSITAAQDQAIKTNYYHSKILKDGTDLA